MFSNSKKLLKLITRILGNLQFAILLLLLIALFSSIGTVIEQNQNLQYYQKAYPDIQNFFNWKIIIFLQLDKVFQAWWYFFLIFILSCSLTFCSIQVQYPLIRISRKYTFLTSPKQFKKGSISKLAPKESFHYLLSNLLQSQYCLYYKKKFIYAHKGLAGKIAPVLIHFSLILALFGITLSSLTGYIAQEMVVKGEIFHIQNLTNFGSLSHTPQQFISRVNNFWIKYNNNGSIDQFFSEISILDMNYHEEKKQIISVNHPLKYKGYSIYQTDWDILGIRLLLDNQFIIQLPLQKNENFSTQKLWIASLNNSSEPFLSFVIQDLQTNDNILVYNSEGKFINTTQINDSFIFQNKNIQVLDLITSTGLQIKRDNGIFLVYTAFLFMMFTVILNCISYSQFWILTGQDRLYLSNKNNKDLKQAHNYLLNLLRNFYLMQKQ
uniref:c-type cytochrome biogenensis protein n=1 Tax=Rhodaphanes brevistipitata TaxID=446136 RepID=UPI001FCD038C|nr:c-type cytochrome biogenensis protein [Rhodaphanes brevistipitata]UNJ18483.1 c-type cytochrome biogenensis protein [Rhodaphanes brevistipitata]